MSLARNGGVSDFVTPAYGGNGAAAAGLTTNYIDVSQTPRISLLVANLTALAPDDTITVQFMQASDELGLTGVVFGDAITITIPGADESPAPTEVYLVQLVDREIAGITDGNQYVGAVITTSEVANVDAHFVKASERYN